MSCSVAVKGRPRSRTAATPPDGSAGAWACALPHSPPGICPKGPIFSARAASTASMGSTPGIGMPAAPGGGPARPGARLPPRSHAGRPPRSTSGSGFPSAPGHPPHTTGGGAPAAPPGRPQKFIGMPAGGRGQYMGSPQQPGPSMPKGAPALSAGCVAPCATPAVRGSQWAPKGCGVPQSLGVAMPLGVLSRPPGVPCTSPKGVETLGLERPWWKAGVAFLELLAERSSAQRKPGVALLQFSCGMSLMLPVAGPPVPLSWRFFFWLSGKLEGKSRLLWLLSFIAGRKVMHSRPLGPSTENSPGYCARKCFSPWSVFFR
mmetsp:Transcript_98815/g.213256  ORF Transcript_98815/g.213256 Transcript_98815/m.213256 type:complete len:318 (+) Transcript_98815:880-1833(+)